MGRLSNLSGFTAVVAVVGYVLVLAYNDVLSPWQIQVAVIALGLAFLWSTSGRLVTLVLDWAQATSEDDESITDEDRDVGVIVGKAENVLLPTFILAEAYTGLSVIFAAKGLVRREDIQNDTLYYLGCTMTNVTYSVVVGVVIRFTLEALGVGQVAFLVSG